MPFSKRVAKEYCVSFSTPLAEVMLPLPLFKSPCQTADALRFIGDKLIPTGQNLKSSS
jgi:hypothetical protein